MTAIVGFISGICASMGLGGGFVLMLYLSLFTDTPLDQSRLINLIFFIPVAAFSLFSHIKNGFVDKKAALFSIIGGIAGVFIGLWLSGMIPSELLSKIFAAVILIIGIKEVFSKK